MCPLTTQTNLSNSPHFGIRVCRNIYTQSVYWSRYFLLHMAYGNNGPLSPETESYISLHWSLDEGEGLTVGRASSCKSYAKLKLCCLLPVGQLVILLNEPPNPQAGWNGIEIIWGPHSRQGLDLGICRFWPIPSIHWATALSPKAFSMTRGGKTEYSGRTG